MVRTIIMTYTESSQHTLYIRMHAEGPVRYAMPTNLRHMSDNAAICQLRVTLRLLDPVSIQKLEATADYHSIYILCFSLEDARALLPYLANPRNGSIDLILQLPDHHLPRFKTLNELACINWVRPNPAIPVPAVVRFDVTTNNSIGHEFMLLEHIQGVSVDRIYDNLDASAKHYLVSQLITYLAELYPHPWNYVGGLSIVDDDVVPGPALHETFWQTHDIGKHWDAGETVQSLNISGPYISYVEYSAACLRRYCQNIEKHSSLAPYRNLVPRLESLVRPLRRNAA